MAPLSRYSNETCKAAEISNSKSIEIPRLPSSILLRWSVLICKAVANCSCGYAKRSIAFWLLYYLRQEFLQTDIYHSKLYPVIPLILRV